MAIKISGNNVVDNNRRGIFQKVNPGSYNNSNRPSASTGDIIYNTDEQSLQVWNGSEWAAVGGLIPLTATGGNTIRTYTDALGAEYKAHIFTSSGTFTVTALGDEIIGDSVEYLVVAGGGGGGAYQGWNQGSGGGGGAGGLRTNVAGHPQAGGKFPVSATSYTVTVGAGGAGGGVGGSTAESTPGNDSAFGSIVATGGGAGGSWRPGTPIGGNAQNPGLPGGSGGGGAGQAPGGDSSPLTSPAQGTPGGIGIGTGPLIGAGGGGAQIGPLTPAINGPLGEGGRGVQVFIAGDSTYTGVGESDPGTNTYQWFAGGGGGGGSNPRKGGIGGGADGGNANIGGGSGTANTGGGGGGNGYPYSVSSPATSFGGSGIVIIRYRIA